MIRRYVTHVTLKMEVLSANWDDVADDVADALAEAASATNETRNGVALDLIGGDAINDGTLELETYEEDPR